MLEKILRKSLVAGAFLLNMNGGGSENIGSYKFDTEITPPIYVE